MFNSLGGFIFLFKFILFLCLFNHFLTYADFLHPWYSVTRKFRLTLGNIYIFLYSSSVLMTENEQSLLLICSPASWHQGLQKYLSFIFFHLEMQPCVKTIALLWSALPLFIYSFVILLYSFWDGSQDCKQSLQKKRCVIVYCHDNVMFFLKSPNILFAFQIVAFPSDIINIDECSQNVR